MSGAKIARALLAADATLLAQVPATRIIAGVVPQGTPLPCLAVTEVSGTDRQTVSVGATVKVTERIQVTVMAGTYPAVKTILALVRSACRGQEGVSAGGYTGVTCRLDGKGPDFQDADSAICMQSQDLLITFDETS